MVWAHVEPNWTSTTEKQQSRVVIFSNRKEKFKKVPIMLFFIWGIQILI